MRKCAEIFELRSSMLKKIRNITMPFPSYKKETGIATKFQTSIPKNGCKNLSQRLHLKSYGIKSLKHVVHNNFMWTRVLKVIFKGQVKSWFPWEEPGDIGYNPFRTLIRARASSSESSDSDFKYKVWATSYVAKKEKAPEGAKL